MMSRMVMALVLGGWLAGRTLAAPLVEAPPTAAARLAAEVEAALQVLAGDGLSVDFASAGEAALEAAVRTLDPAARLLSPEQAAHLRQESAGRDYSVAIRCSMTNGQPVVAEVLDASPEAAGGMQAGDLLRAVNGCVLTNTVLPAVLPSLRADTPGNATLLVVRAGTVFTAVVARTLIELPAVETAEKWPRDLAYLKVNGLFTPESGRELVATVRGWSETGRFGCVLDLRGAGGGDLKAVETLGSLLARGGDLLFTFRDREDQDLSVHKAHEGEPLHTPLLVLVDRNTRGAAEVLAAVLKDSVAGALLVGEPTAGDPLVREVMELPGGRLLQVAQRRLVTADGQVYDGRAGLVPDLTVTRTATPADAYEAEETMPDRRTSGTREAENRALRERMRGDLVVRQAVDILLGLKAFNPGADGASSSP